jgi:hypothetical protein
MSESTQSAPVPQTPTPTEGYHTGSVIVNPLPDEVAFPLREDQFQTLCDGSSSDAKSGMYLYIGLFVSAVVGVFSLFENADWASFLGEQTRNAHDLLWCGVGHRGWVICWFGHLLLSVAEGKHSVFKAQEQD